LIEYQTLSEYYLSLRWSSWWKFHGSIRELLTLRTVICSAGWLINLRRFIISLPVWVLANYFFSTFSSWMTDTFFKFCLGFDLKIYLSRTDVIWVCVGKWDCFEKLKLVYLLKLTYFRVNFYSKFSDLLSF